MGETEIQGRDIRKICRKWIYIDEEEFNEYLEENDYDNAMDEDPNGFINKMYQWFESKTGQKFQDQWLRKDPALLSATL